MIGHDDEFEVDEPAKVAASPQPAGERKTVEAWAAAKGMYPQTVNPPPATLPRAAQGQGGVVAVQMAGLKAPAHNPDFWKFAAAKAMHGWVIGTELTEAEFDAAIQAATTATGG
jgi:hypothetical protein